jgi:ABC-type Na+ efflux pump permease subunit
MRAIWTLALLDVRKLTRSRIIAAMLIAYPVALALIVGGILLHQGPPRVALVNEDTGGGKVTIGGNSFSIDNYIRKAQAQGVDIVRLDRTEADRALADGQVGGVLVIPAGTTAQLETELTGVPIEFHTGEGALGTVIAQRMRGVIYQINQKISRALIDTNSDYLETLVEGGRVDVSGKKYELYGLDPVARDLEDVQDQLADDPDADPDLVDRVDSAVDFAKDAGSAIGLARGALEATASPIRLQVSSPTGASPVLTALALAFGLATLIAFACTVLVAASLAGERDDAVLSRLLAGIARPAQIVMGKLVFGALVGAVLAVGLFIAFAILGEQSWSRLPLLLLAGIVAGLASSSIGPLIAVNTRDARTATLVALLIVLPLIPLMLVSIDGTWDAVIHVMPLEPSRQLFNTVLFDRHPGHDTLVHGAQLLGITLVAGALTTRLLRRLA